VLALRKSGHLGDDSCGNTATVAAGFPIYLNLKLDFYCTLSVFLTLNLDKRLDHTEGFCRCWWRKNLWERMNPGVHSFGLRNTGGNNIQIDSMLKLCSCSLNDKSCTTLNGDCETHSTCAVCSCCCKAAYIVLLVRNQLFDAQSEISSHTRRI